MTQSTSTTIEKSVTAGLVGSGDLLALIRSEPDPDLHIFRWVGKWEVTNEWLCGGFAGRSFVGDTLEQAAEQLSEYLTRHIGHKSMVGDAVTRSGWPNLAAVKRYLLSRPQPDEDDRANANVQRRSGDEPASPSVLKPTDQPPAPERSL